MSGPARGRVFWPELSDSPTSSSTRRRGSPVADVDLTDPGDADLGPRADLVDLDPADARDLDARLVGDATDRDVARAGDADLENLEVGAGDPDVAGTLDRDLEVAGRVRELDPAAGDRGEAAAGGPIELRLAADQLQVDRPADALRPPGRRPGR